MAHPSYDYDIARKAAALSELAYELNYNELRRQIRLVFGTAALVRILPPFARTNTPIVLVETDGEFFIGIRGSVASVRSWLVNLRTSLVARPYPTNVWVHKGFNQVVQDIWAYVFPSLLRAKSAGKTICVTGHSQGGAVAHLFATDALLGHRVPTDFTISFGQPKLGNSGMIRSFEARLSDEFWRAVNAGDPVTALPPWQTYRHSTYLLFGNRAGTLEVRSGRTRLGGFRLRAHKIKSYRSVIDHNPTV